MLRPGLLGADKRETSWLCERSLRAVLLIFGSDDFIGDDSSTACIGITSFCDGNTIT